MHTFSKIASKERQRARERKETTSVDFTLGPVFLVDAVPDDKKLFVVLILSSSRHACLGERTTAVRGCSGSFVQNFAALAYLLDIWRPSVDSEGRKKGPYERTLVGEVR